MVRSFEVRSSCVFEHAVIWQQFDQAPRFELSFVIQQVFGVWRYTRCDMFNATSTWHILDNVAHWCSFDTSNWCRWRVSDTPLPLKHILYSTPPFLLWCIQMLTVGRISKFSPPLWSRDTFPSHATFPRWACRVCSDVVLASVQSFRFICCCCCCFITCNYKWSFQGELWCALMICFVCG